MVTSQTASAAVKLRPADSVCIPRKQPGRNQVFFDDTFPAPCFVKQQSATRDIRDFLLTVDRDVKEMDFRYVEAHGAL